LLHLKEKNGAINFMEASEWAAELITEHFPLSQMLAPSPTSPTAASENTNSL
jgi:hypothetical protein